MTGSCVVLWLGRATSFSDDKTTITTLQLCCVCTHSPPPSPFEQLNDPKGGNGEPYALIEAKEMFPAVTDNVGSVAMDEVTSDDFDGLILDIEPTPLSDVFHQHHHQQQQHLTHDPTQPNPLEIGLVDGQCRQDQQYHQACVDFFDECGLFATAHRDKRRRGQDRGVHFASEAMIISNGRDIEEILTSWYSRDELSVFKQERKDIVKGLKLVKFDLSRFDTSANCLRGLEAYSSISYNKLMQGKRENVVKSVLAEQARQRSLAVKDPSSLREVCVRASEWARERALELGREDAREQGYNPIASAAAEEDWGNGWGNESSISQASTTPSLCSSVASSSCYSSDGSPAMTMGKASSLRRFASPTMTTGKSAAMAKYTFSPTASRGYTNLMFTHPSATTGTASSTTAPRNEPMMWSPQSAGNSTVSPSTRDTTESAQRW